MIELGRRPEGLPLHATHGEPWSAQLQLVLDDGTPVAWPAAPRLVSGLVDQVATLSEADSVAGWTLTAAQVATLGTEHRIVVAETTLWRGFVSHA